MIHRTREPRMRHTRNVDIASFSARRDRKSGIAGSCSQIPRRNGFMKSQLSVDSPSSDGRFGPIAVDLLPATPAGTGHAFRSTNVRFRPKAAVQTRPSPTLGKQRALLNHSIRQRT